MTRALSIALALVALPLLVYAPTVLHEYGFRDDYAHLREVRERPGWLMQLTTANGRPVFGAVLEASVGAIRQVDELRELRLLGAVLIALTGVLLWWYLRRRGWSDSEAAAYGALVTLLPGAQIVVGWAIAWPIALGLVMAVAGFALVDAGLERARGARALRVGAGAALYFAAGLTYQTSAMFVFAPLAAVLLARRGAALAADARFVATHAGVLLASLVAGYVLMSIVVVEGVVPEVARMRLEPEPFTKLLWFVRQPLPNALALFGLRDSLAEHASFWISLGAVLAIIALGFVHGARQAQQRARWLCCLLVLPVAAHAVSLAASSQAIGYRTLLPMSGVFLAVFVFALRALVARYRLGPAVYVGVVVVAAVLAASRAYELIAVPQGREWQIVTAAAQRVDPSRELDVYIIRPGLEDRSTEHAYADEFGTLSADADWAAREMFGAAVRQRFPAGLPSGASLKLTTSFYAPPWPSLYDLVVDMRVLRTLGGRGAAAPDAS
jgi:hypothetical protein